MNFIEQKREGYGKGVDSNHPYNCKDITEWL